MSYKARGDSIRFERDKTLAALSTEIKEHVDSISGDLLARVLNSSAYNLGAMLNNGEITSVQLLRIFTYRASTIGKDLSAITEDNYQDALKIAQECDRLRKEKGWKNASISSQNHQEFSPLFGVPISIKDTFDMKGLATTLGCIEKYSQKCQKDGKIIQVLKLAGLVPFVKSNLPQLGMTFESSNRIFGATKNPWNKIKVAGGSTGGEASLLASRSSPLGMGSDIGGSLRNPAQFCGVCSLKPNSERFMISGHSMFTPSICGQTNIKLALGPMGRHVDDLACFMKIVGEEKYTPSEIADPYKKIIPFDWKVYQSLSEKPEPLRIGYFDSLQIFPSSKACRRAVHETIELLRSQGHTIIPIKIPHIMEIVQVMVSSVTAEGGLKGYRELLQGQPLHQIYALLDITSRLPKFLVWILSKALSKIKPRMGLILSCAREQSAYEYLHLSSKAQKAKSAFVEMWNQDKLDFVICPGFAFQAPNIGSTNDFGALPAIYNFIFNVLDLPCGSLPVTVCNQDQTVYESSYNDVFTVTAQRTQKDANGLPVGIQVAALPFQEQRVLGLMKYLESQIKFTEKYPYPM